jgi:type IV pilus assembly protein PilV
MLRAKRNRREFGFSLVEVMVSVLVTSVSLLGMAGMQITSKRAGHEAIQRTAATAMAMDILERMRSNPQAVAAYSAAAIGGGSIEAEPSPNCSNDDTEICTSLQLAAHDLWEWEQMIDGATETRIVDESTVYTGGLVNPTGCIAINGGLVTVTMVWEGFEELSSPGDNLCGAGADKYGADDARRQLISVSTFITGE